MIDSEASRAAFERRNKDLDLTKKPDAWGNPAYVHSHIDAMWHGWQCALAEVKARAGEPQAYVYTYEEDGVYPELHRRCYRNAYGPKWHETPLFAMPLLAQGIEAATADETGTGSAVGESPVVEDHAPEPSAQTHTTKKKGE